eukprot:sb/3469527/
MSYRSVVFKFIYTGLNGTSYFISFISPVNIGFYIYINLNTLNNLSLEGEVSSKDRQLAELSGNKSDVDSRLEHLRDSHREQSEKVASLERNCDSLSENLRGREAQIENHIKEISGLRDKIEDLHAAVTHGRKLHEALMSEKGTLEEENSSLLKSTTTLKEEIRAYEMEMVVAKKDVSYVFKFIYTGLNGTSYFISFISPVNIGFYIYINLNTLNVIINHNLNVKDTY